MTKEIPNYYSSEQQLPGIIRVLANVNDITLSEETLDNMVVIASACGIADDEVDRCRDSYKRGLIKNDAIEYLFGNDDCLNCTESSTFSAYEESMNKLKGVVDAMPEKRRHILELRLKIWNRLSEEQRNTTDIEESIGKRRVDLNVTGGIYLSPITSKEREARNYKIFYKDFRKMVRIAGMLDDAMDMPDDYANEITRLNPTLLNRARFVRMALIEGIGMFSYAFNPTLVKDSIKIMHREFRRRTTKNNNEQYHPLNET